LTLSGGQSAEGRYSRDGQCKYETLLLDKLAVSTLVQGNPAAHRQTGNKGSKEFLMISSEVEELVEGSQRVVVCAQGR